MRIIQKINHPTYSITIFQAGSRYIVQFENGDLTQSYRYQSTDRSCKDLINDILPSLTELVGEVFGSMRSNYRQTMPESTSDETQFDEII